MARSKAPRGVSKMATGISGFDELLEGGLPRGRALLITGAAGTGKTSLMNEFLYRGIERFGEAAVLVTFEERPDDIVRNMAGFGWDYERLQRTRELAIVDASPAQSTERELDQRYDLEPLLLRVRHAVRRVRAKRLAIDSIEGLFGRLSNTQEVRELLFRLAAEAKALGVTTMMAGEMSNGTTRHGVEEFVADGVVELQADAGQQRIVRRIVVRKMRGTGYRSGVVEFSIDGAGLQVFPKLFVDRTLARTTLRKRRRFGIAGFDELIGGGLPDGYMALVSGNTGTGKSTFMQHFLSEGLGRGESAVYVALEEPSGMVRRLAAQHGWNLARYERAGKLRILDVPLIDIRPDELLYQVVRTVRELKATRVVLDSMSSLKSATMNAEQVRQFMIQLGEHVKAAGATCVMSYLVTPAFGAQKGQLMGALSATDVRLSSAVDCVILQRYVEREQQVRKLLTVLKMRGVPHDKAIYAYEIGRKGVKMGERFAE